MTYGGRGLRRLRNGEILEPFRFPYLYASRFNFGNSRCRSRRPFYEFHAFFRPHDADGGG